MVTAGDYEVIAVDVGSVPPMEEATVKGFGENFRLMRFADAPSPASAINEAVRHTRGRAVSVAIDGARMLSPRVLDFTLRALKAYENPVVGTIAWHLGPKLQNVSMLEGYNQSVEDRLLQTVNWKDDGYELFKIASLAASSRNGWFGSISESNFLTVRREAWRVMGGFEERFTSPGGGLVNLDFFREACDCLGQLVLLLGEGTFHQFHGGVATNVPMANHPGASFHDEYVRIRGKDFQKPSVPAEYLGTFPAQAYGFIAATLPESQT
jgi:glycosyltransferase involved in cell wall biosynthesis